MSRLTASVDGRELRLGRWEVGRPLTRDIDVGHGMSLPGFAEVDGWFEASPFEPPLAVGARLEMRLEHNGRVIPLRGILTESLAESRRVREGTRAYRWGHGCCPAGDLAYLMLEAPVCGGEPPPAAPPADPRPITPELLESLGFEQLDADLWGLEVRDRDWRASRLTLSLAGRDWLLLSGTRRINRNQKSVTSFLTRFADKNWGCRVETGSKRRSEPSYLYRTADVWPALEKWMRDNAVD